MKELETKNRFLELRALGHSYSKIAKELRVSKQTLINWSKELRTELQNLAALRRDEFLESQRANFEKRLSILGNLYARTAEELERRDLTEVPTERLAEMLLKLERVLHEGAPPLTFRQPVLPGNLFGDKNDIEWKG